MSSGLLGCDSSLSFRTRCMWREIITVFLVEIEPANAHDSSLSVRAVVGRTEARYQRLRDAGSQQHQWLDDDVDDDESLMTLMLIFVVVPVIGFSVIIVFIYRRVAHNRSTYHGISSTWNIRPNHKWSTWFDIRPHRRRVRIIQRHLPGCNNVHPCLIGCMVHWLTLVCVSSGSAVFPGLTAVPNTQTANELSKSRVNAV